MTYKVKFCNNQEYEPWWKNFRDYISDLAPVPDEQYTMYIATRDKELAKYNAIRSDDPFSIEFEDKEEALMFVMKWS
jgi:hypothetical protein